MNENNSITPPSSEVGWRGSERTNKLVEIITKVMAGEVTDKELDNRLREMIDERENLEKARKKLHEIHSNEMNNDVKKKLDEIIQKIEDLEKHALEENIFKELNYQKKIIPPGAFIGLSTSIPNNDLSAKKLLASYAENTENLTEFREKINNLPIYFIIFHGEIDIYIQKKNGVLSIVNDIKDEKISKIKRKKFVTTRSRLRSKRKKSSTQRSIPNFGSIGGQKRKRTAKWYSINPNRNQDKEQSIARRRLNNALSFFHLPESHGKIDEDKFFIQLSYPSTSPWLHWYINEFTDEDDIVYQPKENIINHLFENINSTNNSRFNIGIKEKKTNEELEQLETESIEGNDFNKKYKFINKTNPEYKKKYSSFHLPGSLCFERSYSTDGGELIGKGFGIIKITENKSIKEIFNDNTNYKQYLEMPENYYNFPEKKIYFLSDDTLTKEDEILKNDIEDLSKGGKKVYLSEILEKGSPGIYVSLTCNVLNIYLDIKGNSSFKPLPHYSMIPRNLQSIYQFPYYKIYYTMHEIINNHQKNNYVEWNNFCNRLNTMLGDNKFTSNKKITFNTVAYNNDDGFTDEAEAREAKKEAIELARELSEKLEKGEMADATKRVYKLSEYLEKGDMSEAQLEHEAKYLYNLAENLKEKDMANLVDDLKEKLLIMIDVEEEGGNYYHPYTELKSSNPKESSLNEMQFRRAAVRKTDIPLTNVLARYPPGINNISDENGVSKWSSIKKPYKSLNLSNLYNNNLSLDEWRYKARLANLQKKRISRKI